ncbi:MAG: hypothetical protein ACI4EU_10210 [Butyrivibrio sp.]
MKRFKQVMHKILFPGPVVVLSSVPVAAGLLVYTFVFSHKDNPVAYIAYVFSAYSLTIVCTYLVKKTGNVREKLKSAVHSIPVAHRYFTDDSFKLHMSLYISLGMNVAYAVIKFICGIRYHSVWFGTLAVYYFCMAVMRFVLLYNANRNGFGKDIVSELKQYRLCGIILMVMNAALSGVVILVVRKNEGFQYAGYLIYIMAIYAFCNITISVMDVVKYRKYNSPAMSAAKAVNLASALVCILSLETAMLAQFDNGSNPAAFRQVMTGCTGACVCVIVLGIAVYMIINSTEKIRRFKRRTQNNR